MSVTIRRDSSGASTESYSRWRNRRNAMGNVMEGVRPQQLRTLGATLNHICEHDTNERTAPVAPEAASNVVVEHNYGLAAILGFPVSSSSSSLSPVAEESALETEIDKKEQSEGEDSAEETERILRSPVHKRRRNALADALAEVDQESLHRIQRLHANAAHHSHERW